MDIYSYLMRRAPFLMKTIGIIGAMEEEISQIKSKMDVISVKNIIGADFYLGKMQGNNIILVRSGIGKVNAAICAQVLIDFYAIDYCVNIGVAGGINSDLNIGDIVISRDVVHHDLDVSVFGCAIGEIPRLNIRFIEADGNLIKLAEEKGRELLTNNKVLVGRIASGDQFISSAESKAIIWNNTKSDCVEMEGAAIAQTCFLNKIPFVIIRSISDKADSIASVNFRNFTETTAANASSIVESMSAAL